ncbi:MAG: TonB-dependent siderophore receptor [Acidobacteriota bacterium]
MRTFTVLFLALFSLALSLPAAAEVPGDLRGIVVDPAGLAVVAAPVFLRAPGAAEQRTLTDAQGRFAFEGVPAGAWLVVVADGFETATWKTGQALTSSGAEPRIELRAAVIADEITVVAPSSLPLRSTTATKTDTPLRDVPQAVTVITRAAIEQQSMQSMADVVRYVPGIGMAQGEGNRDTPVFRGNSSTSDFFVDGIRDDVQYFRDLYNVERVEALKGPNAMIFGRGGVGGVLNRVTRQAGWSPSRELTLQGGSWDDRRAAGDFGLMLTDTVAARVTGVYESSDSYRDGVRLDRQGINPTFSFLLGANTLLRAGYEHFHDDRTADRGIPSFAGRPVLTAPSTFFGDADRSRAEATVDTLSASLEHAFNERVTLRSRIGYGDYDKFYQNVFPGAVDAAGEQVSISAYNNATRRRNLFSQTDLVVTRRTGPLGHTLLAGVELGQQVTDNLRNTGYFASVGANVTAVLVPLDTPRTTQPLTFRPSATDADNHGVARVAAVYAQDQLTVSSHLQIVAGLRYDRFAVDLDNHRTGAKLSSTDGLVSPRLGLVYKPSEPVSLYASYSLSYLPRAGEQLSSLSVTNQSLEPEEFRNYELGAKWDVAGRVELSTAVYRLERSNVAVPDPVNPTVSLLVDGQRTEGVEWSASGNLTEGWSIVAAYAYQEGEITRSLSATAQAGARLAQLPRHSVSLWNKVDLTSAWGVGLGVVHRGEIFTSTDNTVTLPSFTRVDAALYYTVSRNLRAQVNVENLFDTDYYASANSNTNITPGSPRAVRVSWSTRF